MASILKDEKVVEHVEKKVLANTKSTIRDCMKIVQGQISEAKNDYEDRETRKTVTDALKAVKDELKERLDELAA